MNRPIKIGDIVTHKKTGLQYVVVGCIDGATYNDGVQDWVNVKTGINPIHYYSFPLNDLT